MKKLLFFIVVALALNSCSSSSAVTVKTTSEYLTNNSSKKWKVSNATAVSGGASINLMTYYSACVTDNILILNKDYTYQLTEGATKCDATLPDIVTADVWSLTESPKAITINKFAFLNKTLSTSVFNITSIDDNNFTGTLNTTYNNSAVTATVVFTAVN